MQYLPLARLLSLLVVIPAIAVPAPGQERTATPPSEPTLKLSPTKALEKFEPPADEEYTLGPGDEISLDFPGRPELDGKKVVGPDGRVTLPIAGAVQVADKTRAQAADLIVAALSPYYKDLTLTVGIDKYGSNRVVILGNVQHPGVLYFDTTPTLLDAVARGGLMASTQGEPGKALTARDGIPERCAIYRGDDQVIWVDLKDLLQSGNPMADLRLRRNDIVFVPAQQEVFVSVLGRVEHPGAIPLTPQSTLTSILAQAGGLAEGASSKIQIVQPSTGTTRTVSFDDLRTVNGAEEVTLHGGDLIYVPGTGFYKTTYALQRLSSAITIGTVAAAFLK